jgi:lipopolysaccharide transport system ATP-binding protein
MSYNKNEVGIQAEGLSKCFYLYEKSSGRIKQAILPRLRKLFGQQSKNYYTEFWALKGITLDIQQGETLGIVGPNGSGKSTLLQLLCGTLTPTQGSYRIQGRIAALLELGFGFSMEFTGRENVYLNGLLLGLTNHEISERFDDIASFADIGEFLERPVKEYSSGMYVRLAFAILAHVDADILVIDEALAVGDAAFTQKCMRFLRQFEGIKILASHDVAAITSLCTRVLWLDLGGQKLLGPPKKVCEGYLSFLLGQKINKNSQAATPPNSTKPESKSNESTVDSMVKSFGAGGARISSVEMLDEEKNPLTQIKGEEVVTLCIDCQILSEINNPIVGFLVKDRLGQVLFGDNTCLSYSKSSIRPKNGQLLQVHFCFKMPILPNGKYFISSAIAEGSQQDALQHHWVHEALTFTSISGSVCTGLVGIPMISINMKTS